MSFKRFSMAALLLAIMVLPVGCFGAEPAVKFNPARKFKWLVNYDQATALARKDNKTILLYFSGSDWDPWTQKLEKDVLGTDEFKLWAIKNIIPLQVDFARDKHVSSITKGQDDRLKTRYNINTVPVFEFLDPTGDPYARGGYKDMYLRNEEKTGHPDQTIAFLDATIKARPKDEALKNFANFADARAFARKNFAVMVLAVTQGAAPYWIEQRDLLFKDQQFVRWVNHNCVFFHMDWPAESDNSVSAQEFRAFVAKQKLTPSPFQLIVWDAAPAFDKVKARYRSFSLQHVDQLINHIAVQLPRVDYSGGWITDYKLAQTISAQTGRYIFMAFTSMDGGVWSKIMDDEIFKSKEFKDYAGKRLVLLSVDFPKSAAPPPAAPPDLGPLGANPPAAEPAATQPATRPATQPAATQPAALKIQNQMLLENFDVPGFPFIIVVNPKGEKIVQSKYLKGGATFFMKQLEPIVEQDADRLKALKEDN